MTSFAIALADESGNEDPTAITEVSEIRELVAETRGEPTPALPVLPLGAEAGALADRVRYVLQVQLGFSEASADAVLARARELMPRGRR